MICPACCLVILRHRHGTKGPAKSLLSIACFACSAILRRIAAIPEWLKRRAYATDILETWHAKTNGRTGPRNTILIGYADRTKQSAEHRIYRPPSGPNVQSHKKNGNGTFLISY